MMYTDYDDYGDVAYSGAASPVMRVEGSYLLSENSFEFKIASVTTEDETITNPFC